MNKKHLFSYSTITSALVVVTVNLAIELIAELAQLNPWFYLLLVIPFGIYAWLLHACNSAYRDKEL